MIWLHESHYAVYNLLSAFECRTGEDDEVIDESVIVWQSKDILQIYEQS